MLNYIDFDYDRLELEKKAFICQDKDGNSTLRKPANIIAGYVVAFFKHYKRIEIKSVRLIDDK